MTNEKEGRGFMAQKFIDKTRQDKEFQQLYDIEKKKLDIAVALANARRQRGMTQSDVARKARTSWETISRIEHGKLNPSLDVLSRIFAAVGKRLDLEIS
jgi:DNA-binding XRE family transcriptional regulator